MHEEREILSFIHQLNSEVLDRSTGENGNSTDFKENIFTEIVVEHLTEIGMVENSEICHYSAGTGNGYMKVNGYAVNEEEDKLDLFATIFNDTQETLKISNEEIVKAGRATFRFFQAAKKGLHKKMEAASDAYSMASRIFDLRTQIEEVRIFILVDGQIRAKKLIDGKDDKTKVHFEAWDIERLFRGLQAGLPRDEIQVDLLKLNGSAIPCLPMPNPAEDYDVFFTILPGDILFQMYDEYGSRLLELNVRSFLQARGKVNRGIRDTLRKEPDRFLAYNNGISVTAESLGIATLPDGRPAIESIRGLQIVNGGQTTASIHRAKKQDKTDLSGVYVPVKITVIENPKLLDELVPKISQYANTQNVIQIADFSANEPFHIAIERLSEAIWCPGQREKWFYERARGQYQVAKSRFNTPAKLRKFNDETPPSRKFTKTDLAKFVHSWDQLPYYVSKGGQKNFIHFMDNLRKNVNKDWQPDDTYYKSLIAKAIIFKAVQKIVREENFPAYRANIVTYLVSYISCINDGKIDLLKVWNNQSISSELEKTLRSWSYDISGEILKSSNGRNITEWCKKEDCWKIVSTLKLV